MSQSFIRLLSDRRTIYLLVFLSLSVPLVLKLSFKPARLEHAESFFNMVEELDPAKGIAFVSMDFGPNTVAESGAQAELILEHLMRKRVKFSVFSVYNQAEPFLDLMPKRVAAKLMKEMPAEQWRYGQDWVNLGYRPGTGILLESVPRSTDLAEFFKTDAGGAKLKNLPAFANVRTLNDIQLLAEFTGLVGVVDLYFQFFQSETYRPKFGHGCTSITIPQAFIYLDSGQLNGLLEGIAGAAWYSYLLSKNYPARDKDSAILINTGLGVAHLIVIALIVFGNFLVLLAVWRERSRNG